MAMPLTNTLGSAVAEHQALPARQPYDAIIRKSNAPDPIVASGADLDATGKLQKEGPTFEQFAREGHGTPATIESERPTAAGAFRLGALAQFRKSLEKSLSQMDGGQYPDSVKPFRSSLVDLLEQLASIPNEGQWGAGGFKTLDELIGTVGKQHTLVPICAFFEEGIAFDTAMRDPMGTLDAIRAEICRLESRQAELDNLYDLQDDGEEEAVAKILQDSEFSDRTHDSIEAVEESGEEEELRQRLWAKQVELLEHLPKIIDITFRSFHGDKEHQLQVDTLLAEQAQAVGLCADMKEAYLTKGAQLTSATCELRRRSAAVKSEQAEADSAAVDRRGEFQLRQEERSTMADEIHRKVKALLAEAMAQELTGRAEAAENLAAERALQHETAARAASLQMHRQAEEKLAPFVEVFAASAEVCDTMRQVAVGATDAVIEHHKAKVAGLQKKEGEHLAQHFGGVCSAYSSLVKDCATEKFHYHESDLKLRENTVAIKEARRLRRGPHALASLRAKKVELTVEKEQHADLLGELDARMAQLRDSDAFARTVVRLGELYFPEADADGFFPSAGDDETAEVRAAVREWVSVALPPAAPWDELEEVSTAKAEREIQAATGAAEDGGAVIREARRKYFEDMGLLLTAPPLLTPTEPIKDPGSEDTVVVAASLVAGGTVPAVSSSELQAAKAEASKLHQLQVMGFSDKQANLHALQASGGVVQAAVERLLS